MDTPGCVTLAGAGFHVRLRSSPRSSFHSGLVCRTPRPGHGKRDGNDPVHDQNPHPRAATVSGPGMTKPVRRFKAVKMAGRHGVARARPMHRVVRPMVSFVTRWSLDHTFLEAFKTWTDDLAKLLRPLFRLERRSEVLDDLCREWRLSAE